MKLEEADKERALGNWNLKIGLFGLGRQGSAGRVTLEFHTQRFTDGLERSCLSHSATGSQKRVTGGSLGHTEANGIIPEPEVQSSSPFLRRRERKGSVENNSESHTDHVTVMHK